MKQARRFSSDQFEAGRRNASDANARSHSVAAGLLALAILIAGSWIAPAAASRTDDHASAYRVADKSTPPSKAEAHSRAARDQASVAWIFIPIAQAIEITFDLVKRAAEPVWDASLWISRQALDLLATSGLDPNAADHGVARGAGGDRAASVIALGLLGVLLFGVSGPLYYSWKMWRVRRVRTYR